VITIHFVMFSLIVDSSYFSFTISCIVLLKKDTHFDFVSLYTVKYHIDFRINHKLEKNIYFKKLAYLSGQITSLCEHSMFLSLFVIKILFPGS